MTATRDRSGFTLVETMVATTIAALVFGAIAATFIFCQRMFRITMAEAE
ncbi:MAG: prepilin-type N-terminal cleavage/methylation domain-containing protein, partial [Kiritimatiellae bacterium]|nr:prepilin-type N-terminal cleavage/methylation domain-containing protein [Kiritimatiellia bacterium]